MSRQTRVSNQIYSFLPTDVEGVDSLAELALDMRWSWNHAADEVWQQLDPSLWELTHNPCVVLQTVSRDQLRRVLADSAFRKKVDAFVQSKERAASVPGWFQQNYAESPLTCVAYFSMEFMLSEALPIYSNGCAESVLARWHSSAALTPLWFPGTSTNYPGNMAGMLYGYANDSFH